MSRATFIRHSDVARGHVHILFIISPIDTDRRFISTITYFESFSKYVYLYSPSRNVCLHFVLNHLLSKSSGLVSSNIIYLRKDQYYTVFEIDREAFNERRYINSGDESRLTNNIRLSSRLKVFTLPLRAVTVVRKRDKKNAILRNRPNFTQVGERESYLVATDTGRDVTSNQLGISLVCLLTHGGQDTHTHTYVSRSYIAILFIHRDKRDRVYAQNTPPMPISPSHTSRKNKFGFVTRHWTRYWMYYSFVICLEGRIVCTGEEKNATFAEILPLGTNYNSCKNIYNRSKKRFKIITLEKNRHPVLYLLTSSICIIRVHPLFYSFIKQHKLDFSLRFLLPEILY